VPYKASATSPHRLLSSDWRPLVGVHSWSRFQPGQSFSQVIKEIKERLGPVKTGASLLQAVKQIRISEETLDAMEKVVRDRKKSPLKDP